MFKFSRVSKDRLSTADDKLQLLFNEVIKYRDITITEGHRTVNRQKILYAQGRTQPGKIVTYLDGVNKKSKHNYFPSKAVDVVPYPELWSNEEAFEELAVIVKREAKKLGIKIKWGGDFKKFKDRPHYQLV